MFSFIYIYIQYTTANRNKILWWGFVKNKYSQTVFLYHKLCYFKLCCAGVFPTGTDWNTIICKQFAIRRVSFAACNCPPPSCAPSADKLASCCRIGWMETFRQALIGPIWKLRSDWLLQWRFVTYACDLFFQYQSRAHCIHITYTDPHDRELNTHSWAHVR